MSEPLPELPDPPPKVSYLSVFVSVFLLLMAALCFARGNVIGGCVDIGIALLNAGMIVWRYRDVSKLHRQYRNIKIIKECMSIPRYQEVGNSIIFSFISPSQAITDDLHAIAQSFLPKEKKGKK